MPIVGSTGRWPGFAIPVVALVVSLAVTWLFSAVVALGETSAAIANLGLLILLPSPIVVSVIWGGALLIGRPHRLAFFAAVGWLVICWVVLPHQFVWQYLGNVAAGLLAGLALGLRWRLDVALLAMALAMAPLLIFASLEMPIQEQMQLSREAIVEVLEESLPADAKEADNARVMAEFKRNMDSLTDQLTKMYPFLLAVGALGQAAMILTLVWLLAKAGGLRPYRWAFPPFTEWRLPFYLVWVLVAGLGLFFVRQPEISKAGRNLALLAAFVLSAQGLAIQVYVTRRMMSTVRQVLYWVILGTVLIEPGIYIAVALGVLDQWWDLRRLATRSLAEDDNDDESE
jgi:hypothetical protein